MNTTRMAAMGRKRGEMEEIRMEYGEKSRYVEI